MLLSAPARLFSTDAYALTTSRTAEFAGDGRIPSLPFELGQVRLRAEGEGPVLIGIASQADVDRYLAGVQRTEVTDVRYDPFRAEYRDIAGTRAPDDPAAQRFRTESASGAGAQEVTWTVQPDDWAVVVMNAQQFRHQRSFPMSWLDALNDGNGRSSLWLTPEVPFYFKFAGSRVPAIELDWVKRLSESATSSAGLIVTDRTGRPVRAERSVRSFATRL